MEEERFSAACGLFDLRLVNAIGVLAEAKQWFAAAVLVAVAIDVLSDSNVMDGVAERSDYVGYLRNNESFREYHDYADRFYAVLRCGLLHRMQLKDARERDSDFDKSDIEGPIAIGQDTLPPRLKGDYLIIDVPHLIATFKTAYEEFKANPSGHAQRRFAERMKQVILDEHEHGVTPREV